MNQDEKTQENCTSNEEEVTKTSEENAETETTCEENVTDINSKLEEKNKWQNRRTWKTGRRKRGQI